MKSRFFGTLGWLIVAVVIGYGVIYEGFWVWVVENTVVPADQMLVLVAKTGKSMPPGQLIAEPGQKGVLLEPKGPGRYFINPFLYESQFHKQVVIKGDEVGVVISKFGKVLPAGEFLAERGELGIQKQVLLPGTYRLNPHAYQIRVVKMVEIEPGYVGVQTARSGKPASGQLANPGERGVQKSVLQPGFYAINPEAMSVEPIEIGYNQITMAHAGKMPVTQTSGQLKDQQMQKKVAAQAEAALAVLPAVTFPSSDGFEIVLDVTLLWQLLPDDAPSVVSRYGNIRKIEQNILIPQINSTARIKGSTFGAVDFIVGDKREEFQKAFQGTIETTLHEKKLLVDLALVQDTLVPDSISGPIQDARIAAEWNIANGEKTKTEAKKAELMEYQGKIRQIEQVVDFETQRLEGNIKAEQEKIVSELGAQTRVMVAELAKQTAVIKADTRRKLGAAEATVKEMLGKAQGDGYGLQVKAVGTPTDYAYYNFVQALPAKMSMSLIYAGAGTLWTDVDKALKAAPLGVLKQIQDQADKK